VSVNEPIFTKLVLPLQLFARNIWTKFLETRKSFSCWYYVTNGRKDGCHLHIGRTVYFVENVMTLTAWTVLKQ